MSNDPERMKHVPLTNKEIDIVIKLLSQAVPSIDEQDTVFNIVNRLILTRRT